ncbi:MAG TPA: class I SAM-dependent methyltransferase [Bryobacteraceae bacterium]|nr:class I SAM-dependent methyltransferase [Bryobacteraceae bacterium]
MKISEGESRSAERLFYHYEVEKELGDRLRKAAKPDRARMYQSVYDELFSRVPDHPQVTSATKAPNTKKIASQLRLIRPFLNRDTAFLEIGGGDCALSFQAAPLVNRAYGLEITDHLIPRPAPPNFEFVLSDGSSVGLPDNSIDLAFSFSVVEHVHPEDVIQHLAEVHRVLKPGGIYYSVTPNRLLGPHDISRYFDTVATGLHLKEYTIGELAKLYRDTGFQEVWVEKSLKSLRVPVPVPAMRLAEGIVGSMPWAVRSRLGRSRRFFWAMEVSVAGRKSR